MVMWFYLSEPLLKMCVGEKAVGGASSCLPHRKHRWGRPRWPPCALRPRQDGGPPVHAASAGPRDPVRSAELLRLRLVLGLHTLGHPRLAFHVLMAVQHPDYRPAPALENDLALLQLDGKVKPSKTIQPLRLPRSRQVVAAGARCSVAGWGVTHQGGQLARALQELDVRVLDSQMCNSSHFWHGGLPRYVVCLAADRNQAPCKGDSGGPLVCSKGWVAGILSFSSKVCTNVFKPTVATTVAPYVSWIKKVIRH
ncbi:granzyme M isoform X1 [Microcebus murinus]|uniref:granzyme M isoform X1 n=1 Tax=Microcebus murinus TaxID=30608 RepID=UPI003F6C4248